MDNKKLYKVLVTTVVGDLSYEAGQTYELSDEQAAAFAEGEVEVVATPDGDVKPETPEVPETPEATPPAPETPETPEAPAPATPEAPAPEAPKPAEEAKPWPGNHRV